MWETNTTEILDITNTCTIIIKKQTYNAGDFRVGIAKVVKEPFFFFFFNIEVHCFNVKEIAKISLGLLRFTK